MACTYACMYMRECSLVRKEPVENEQTHNTRSPKDKMSIKRGFQLSWSPSAHVPDQSLLTNHCQQLPQDRHTWYSYIQSWLFAFQTILNKLNNFIVFLGNMMN